MFSFKKDNKGNVEIPHQKMMKIYEMFSNYEEFKEKEKRLDNMIMEYDALCKEALEARLNYERLSRELQSIMNQYREDMDGIVGELRNDSIK